MWWQREIWHRRGSRRTDGAPVRINIAWAGGETGGDITPDIMSASWGEVKVVSWGTRGEWDMRQWASETEGCTAMATTRVLSGHTAGTSGCGAASSTWGDREPPPPATSHPPHADTQGKELPTELWRSIGLFFSEWVTTSEMLSCYIDYSRAFMVYILGFSWVYFTW